MGRFLKALEKVGLVELEEGSVAASGPEPEPAEPATEAEPGETTAAPAASAGSGGIDEGMPIESFYTEIPPSPFPAEKMLKLIDGLQAMDAATRKSAIEAMDAADESWGIDDCVADAKAKIAALTRQASAFTAQVTAIEKDTAAALKAIEADNDKAVSAIRKQIAELEALLSRQIEQTGSAKVEAQNRVQAAREACTRETGRLHAEASRLSTLIEMFVPAKEK